MSCHLLEKGDLSLTHFQTADPRFVIQSKRHVMQIVSLIRDWQTVHFAYHVFIKFTITVRHNTKNFFEDIFAQLQSQLRQFPPGISASTCYKQVSPLQVRKETWSVQDEMWKPVTRPSQPRLLTLYFMTRSWLQKPRPHNQGQSQGQGLKTSKPSPRTQNLTWRPKTNVTGCH